MYHPGDSYTVKMPGRQPATLGVSVTFFAIATIFVALRFVSRVFVVRRIALHDYLMLLAWVGQPGSPQALGNLQCPQALLRHTGILCHVVFKDSWLKDRLQVIDLGFSLSLFIAIHNGLGLHAVDVPPENEAALNRANYAFTVLYVSSRKAHQCTTTY